MEEIKKKYRKTVKENLKHLKGVLEDELNIHDSKILEQHKQFLEKSSENLISKWSSGRKYSRTYFVKRAFKKYPQEIYTLSLSLDAIINLLDDILDEDLSKESKAVYVVELIRIFAIYNSQDLSNEIRVRVFNYFNKIIAIAICEELYRNKIKNEKDINQSIKYAINLYDCRSLDIDIYVELPLIKLYPDINQREKDLVLKSARIFRAINLIKKDIIDIEHDKKENTETAITIAYFKKINFKEYIHKLIKYYEEEVEKIKAFNKDLDAIVENFKKMIDYEITLITKEVSSM